MGSYKSNSTVRRHSGIAKESIGQGIGLALESDGLSIYTGSGAKTQFVGFAISAVSTDETVEYEVAQNTYVQCQAAATLVKGEDVGLNATGGVVPIASAVNTNLVIGQAAESITVSSGTLETWINQRIDRLA